MKLTILGGGGFRTPLVYGELLRDRAQPRVDQVALYDPDGDRLAVVGALLAQMASGDPDAPSVTTSSDLGAALDGADFVFAAIRVGGLAGRVADERVALDRGLLGQETTGAGGLSYGLRTVPVMDAIARRIREVAPSAFVLNFTNPAGIVTEAMQAELGDRVVGICDTPSGLGRRVAALSGVDPDEVFCDYVGLNHLGWLRRVLHHGVDVLPELIADPRRLRQLEEGVVFGPDWIQALGSIPNEYLYYYYCNRDAIASIAAASSTRGESLLSSQTAFYAGLRADPTHGYERWQQAVDARSAAYMAEAKAGKPGSSTLTPPDRAEQLGYAGVALNVMAAIGRGERTQMILNVRNGSAVPGLPADAVVEVPAVVDGNGVRPLATAPPDLHQLGLMQQLKHVERLVIRAARTGSVTDAVRAFALHPLVDSISVARELLAAYRQAIPELDVVFSRDR